MNKNLKHTLNKFVGILIELRRDNALTFWIMTVGVAAFICAIIMGLLKDVGIYLLIVTAYCLWVDFYLNVVLELESKKQAPKKKKITKTPNTN